jgi:hypothetical protein
MSYLPLSILKKLLLAAVVSDLVAGCATPHVMYGGPIRMKSDAPSGLLLEGNDKRPIECYPAPGDTLADLEVGHWVVVEGVESHEGGLALGVRDCRVIAVSSANPAPDLPGVALHPRRKQPASAEAPKEEKGPKK